MRVGIHQPVLFPWLGVFDKISRCDCYVYLDHVRSSTTQVLVKRVKVIISGRQKWLTIPLKRDNVGGFSAIVDMRISPDADFTRKHLDSLFQSYGKTPFFEEVYPLIEAFYASEEERIAERNIDFTEQVCRRLRIDTKRMRSSDMSCKASGTELLIEIVEKTGGSQYMCGGGASGYQDDDLMRKAGIEVVYQDFVHPEYPQVDTKEFLPGLSVIDALMNCGLAGVRDILGR